MGMTPRRRLRNSPPKTSMLSIFRLFFGSFNASTFKKVYKQKTLRRQNISDLTSSLLGRGNLRDAVKLPEREDINEWLAANGAYDCRRFQ
jgi:Mob1/phocein family